MKNREREREGERKTTRTKYTSVLSFKTKPHNFHNSYYLCFFILVCALKTCFYSELYACDIQNMQVNTFTLCLVHLQQHRETGWRRMVVILLFEDAFVSYSDDLIQAVQLQVSCVVIFHSESNLRELEELEDRL